MYDWSIVSSGLLGAFVVFPIPDGLSGQPWEPSDIYLESLHVKRRGPGVRVSQELGFFFKTKKMGCLHESLGIQSPSENGNGT